MDHMIDVDWQWVERELLDREKIGLRKDNGGIYDCAAACLKKAPLLSSPKICSSEKSIISAHTGIIEIDDGIKFHSRSLASYLKGADSLCIFLVTIGNALEDEASRLMSEGAALEGYLMDRIGSFAAESIAKNFEDKVRGDYTPRNKSVSMRFSPGYCDWVTEEQSELDRAIDFSRAGVRLTKSFMMVPKKSISAVVGIGAEGLFSPTRRSPCATCDQKDCDYRRN